MASSNPQPVVNRDCELLERVRSGETELFYELICPYQRAVYTAAFSILQNEHDAEETAQEAFLKAFQHINDFRGDAKFSTWLVQIAINEAYKRQRKSRSEQYQSLDQPQTGEEGDYWPLDYADWREIPSESLHRKELREALRRGLESLPQKYREVLVLRDVQNMSISETSEVLKISESNVKQRLLRARLHMRDALAPGFDGAWSIGESRWKKVRPW